MKSSLFQQHVKPFVRGNKNDANDAIAIGEAASRPNMTFVKVKRIEQQDVQSMHRIREERVKVRTGLSNQIRGLLSEYGIVATRGAKGLKALIHEALESTKTTAMFRVELASLFEEYSDLDECIKPTDNRGKLKSHNDSFS